MVPVSSTVMPVDLSERHSSIDDKTRNVDPLPKPEYRKMKRDKTESSFWLLHLF